MCSTPCHSRISRVPAIGLASFRARRLVGAVVLLAERLQPLQRLGLQPAVGQLLDAVGEPALEEAAVEGRRLGLEELAPLLLQVGHRHGLQRGQAREDGVGHAALRRGRFRMTALVGRDV